MTKQHESTRLRQAAEARLTAARGANTVASDHADLPRLVHELQVHQIELQMQNEELHRAQAELEAERANYFDLYHLAPVGYFTLSENGLIQQANLTVATLLGTERGALINQSISRFIFKADAHLYNEHWQQLIETGRPSACELRMVKPDGTPFWAHLATSAGPMVNGVMVFRVVLSDVGERKHAETALQKSEAFSLAILDSLNAEIAVLDRDGTIVAVNQAWRRFALENGIDPGQSAVHVSVGSNYLAVCQSASGLGSEDARNALSGIQAVLDGRLPGYSQDYACDAPGQHRWFNMNVTPFGSGVVVAHMNITERRQAEEALREHQEVSHLIAENIGDFVAVLDRQGRRLYNSPSYLHFFGGNRDLRGTNSFADIHQQDRERVERVFRDTVQSGRGSQIEYRLLIADGSIRDMESRGSVIKDSDGRVVRVVVVSHDITERKQMEDHVRQLAFHDSLTKLPNRRLLNDRLNQSMAASTRTGCHGAIMFLDLDNFKLLNDTHGHALGDLLLIEAANRLKSCVREVDTVARLGGDEFVVMISELDVDKTDSITQAGTVAEKIRAKLSEPYFVTLAQIGMTETTVEHQCTASIGVVLFVNHETSQSDILKWADRAMYQAKEAGRNSIRFYDPKLP